MRSVASERRECRTGPGNFFLFRVEGKNRMLFFLFHEEGVASPVSFSRTEEKEALFAHHLVFTLAEAEHLFRTGFS